MLQKIVLFLKKETILVISALLALFSAFQIPPDAQYMTYCNTDVLILLFCLMAIMAGLQEMGVFQSIAKNLLQKAQDLRELTCILVLLCFFSAMLLTNDVALITFVPFSILLLQIAHLTEQIIPILVLQTIAANLGSMLTPIGNPQNLYLYTVSHMAPLDFIITMLPLTLLSLALLLVCCMRMPKADLHRIPHTPQQDALPHAKYMILALCMLFAATLAAVFQILPHSLLLAVTLLFFVCFFRDVLKKVDYSLLLTFVFFFIFIGNCGRMPIVADVISSTLLGREMLLAFLLSQGISNVPAAILLSGFTDDWKSLLFGVNIGGLGTLIASMASLISYKFLVQSFPEKKNAYTKEFTAYNMVFAVILLMAAYLLCAFS